MSSYRHEERAKSHTAGARMRDDVRFASKGEDSRRFDGPRRLRGGYTSHPYEMENERVVHCNRYNDGLIVRVPNDLCHNPNASSTSRRGQSGNHPQASVRSNFKSANSGYPTEALNQSRNRFETSGKQRSLSFREGLGNVPEPSMLPLEWKPDASRISMEYRSQAKTRQHGNVGRRGMSSTSRASGELDRSSGGRRGGGVGGASNGGGRMRRRGGGSGGDDATASFRVPDNESAHDQGYQTGEKPRGGFHQRGKTRGFRSARRGGSRRGAINGHLGSKNEVEDSAPGVGEHGNSENPEDSNSTDDDQYRLTVDLKTFTVTDPLISDPILTVPISSWSKDDLACVVFGQVDDVQHADVNLGQANDREEHIDGGLNILVESRQEAVDSSEESSGEEEEGEDSEEASEASGSGPASGTDGDTSEVSNEVVEAVEVLEEDGSQAGCGSGEPGPLEEQQGPSVERSRPNDESPPHEHEASQISEEEMLPTDPPMEVIETDPKGRLSHESFEESKAPEDKKPPTEIPPEINETCSQEKGKAHYLAPSSPIAPVDSSSNPQLTQDSGDCETSFESVPADESHNSSNSIINGESVSSGKSVAKEAPLEDSVSKDNGTKAEETPTEKILEGKRSPSP